MKTSFILFVALCVMLLAAPVWGEQDHGLGFELDARLLGPGDMDQVDISLCGQRCNEHGYCYAIQINMTQHYNCACSSLYSGDYCESYHPVIAALGKLSPYEVAIIVVLGTLALAVLAYLIYRKCCDKRRGFAEVATIDPSANTVSPFSRGSGEPQFTGPQYAYDNGHARAGPAGRGGAVAMSALTREEDAFTIAIEDGRVSD